MPKTVIGILDLRSLGSFKVNYEHLEEWVNISNSFHYYKDTSDGISDPIFDRIHGVSNNIRQDINSTKDPYSWLDPDDPRRHQTDAEILRPQISLRGSALTVKEKSCLMTMILKYKKAFSI